MDRNIQKIVVRAPNWIGDAVMATPVFFDLKQLFPRAHIMLLASDSIGTLLHGLEPIDEYMLFSRSKEKKRKEENRVVQLLRAYQADLGVLLPRSFSSAWLFFKAGIPRRLGYSDHFRRWLLTDAKRLPRDEIHDLLGYRELLKDFGSLSKKCSLSLVVTEEEREQMKIRLHALGIPNEDRIILLNPGAAYGTAKCWPPKFFRTLASMIGSSTRTTVLFVGDEASRDWIAELIDGSPDNIRSIAGETSLRELVALISLGDLLVTNDSGPMHIAAALQRPLIALFGSTNPQRTGPWGSGTVLYKQVACSPCYLRQCPKDFCCMSRILPEEVYAHVERMLI